MISGIASTTASIISGKCSARPCITSMIAPRSCGIDPTIKSTIPVIMSGSALISCGNASRIPSIRDVMTSSTTPRMSGRLSTIVCMSCMIVLTIVGISEERFSEISFESVKIDWIITFVSSGKFSRSAGTMVLITIGATSDRDSSNPGSASMSEFIMLLAAETIPGIIFRTSSGSFRTIFGASFSMRDATPSSAFSTRGRMLSAAVPTLPTKSSTS